MSRIDANRKGVKLAIRLLPSSLVILCVFGICLVMIINAIESFQMLGFEGAFLFFACFAFGLGIFLLFLLKVFGAILYNGTRLAFSLIFFGREPVLRRSKARESKKSQSKNP